MTLYKVVNYKSLLSYAEKTCVSLKRINTKSRSLMPGNFNRCGCWENAMEKMTIWKVRNASSCSSIEKVTQVTVARLQRLGRIFNHMQSYWPMMLNMQKNTLQFKQLYKNHLRIEWLLIWEKLKLHLIIAGMKKSR